MDRYEIILVIIYLVTFGIAVCTPILKLNTTITKLISATESLKASQENLTESNYKSHKRIWESLDVHDEKISDHEHRITAIETRQEHRDLR